MPTWDKGDFEPPTAGNRRIRRRCTHARARAQKKCPCPPTSKTTEWKMPHAHVRCGSLSWFALALASCLFVGEFLERMLLETCCYRAIFLTSMLLPMPRCLEPSGRGAPPTVLVPTAIKALVGPLRHSRTDVGSACSFDRLRQNEMFALKWSDIDFAPRNMCVTRTMVYGVVVPCKTGCSQRPVPIPPIQRY